MKLPDEFCKNHPIQVESTSRGDGKVLLFSKILAIVFFIVLFVGLLLTVAIFTIHSAYESYEIKVIKKEIEVLKAAVEKLQQVPMSFEPPQSVPNYFDERRVDFDERRVDFDERSPADYDEDYYNLYESEENLEDSSLDNNDVLTINYSNDSQGDQNNTDFLAPLPKMTNLQEANSKPGTSSSRHVREIVNKYRPNSNLEQESDETPDVEVGISQYSNTRFRHHHYNGRPKHVETFDEFGPTQTNPSTRRPARQGRMRPLPTAHFSGDTTKYVLGQHENFDGNARLRHPHLTFVDWKASDWFSALAMDRHFSLEDGVLTIKESGLYFVYAQIYYYDQRNINGFAVYRNGNILLQCTTMTHSVERVMKGNTCYTAGAEYLHDGDKISLGDLSESSYSLFEPGKSFFGVIKLGDVKINKSSIEPKK